MIEGSPGQRVFKRLKYVYQDKAPRVRRDFPCGRRRCDEIIAPATAQTGTTGNLFEKPNVEPIADAPPSARNSNSLEQGANAISGTPFENGRFRDVPGAMSKARASSENQ